MTSSYPHARSTRRDGCSTQARRGLTVAGRWRYFIHTWAGVIGKAFGPAAPLTLLDLLAGTAAELR